MNSTHSQQPTSTTSSGYMTFVNSCGITSIVLAALMIAHALLVAAGKLPVTPVGVMPIWATAVMILAAVKICQVAADRAADRVSQQITQLRAELHDQLAKVTVEALEAARNTGRWQGIAENLRENQAGNPANVVPFGQRRGNGNGSAV